MRKVFFILILSFLISIIFCQDSTDIDSISSESPSISGESSNDLVDCLRVNNNTEKSSLSLSSCTTYNKDNKIEKDQNKIYCCLLKITYESNKEEKYCMTTVGELDKIDERKEILRYLDKTIKTISIDCSAKYLGTISLVSILILIFILNTFNI